MNIGFKIRQVRKRLGLSQIDMAKKLDVAERTLRQYEQNKVGIGCDFANKLIRVYNVNCFWLFKDEGPMFEDESCQVYTRQVSADTENLVFIPKYEISAAAGAGIEVSQEKVGSFAAFDKHWLKNVINASPNMISAIIAEGDSMEPTIKSGDLILVDHSKNTPNDGIYVIRLGNSLIVKRIQCLPDYKIEAMSDNPIYKSFEIDLKEEQDAAIVGRVVWFGRDMRV